MDNIKIYKLRRADVTNTQFQFRNITLRFITKNAKNP